MAARTRSTHTPMRVVGRRPASLQWLFIITSIATSVMVALVVAVVVMATASVVVVMVVVAVVLVVVVVVVVVMQLPHRLNLWSRRHRCRWCQ